MNKMQNIETILKDFGLEIPEEKREDFRVRFHENYKTVNDYTKLETDRDNWKSKAETAEETLKSFDGIDPAKIQQELKDWQEKAKKAERDAQAQLYERDFADALKGEMEGYKFTSEAAKKSIMAEIKEAGLKLKDGKILGLSDLIEQIKKSDASAFVDEHQAQLENNKARFTQPQKPGSGAKTGKQKLLEMSLDERMKLKASDPELYNSMRNS